MNNTILDYTLLSFVFTRIKSVNHDSSTDMQWKSCDAGHIWKTI